MSKAEGNLTSEPSNPKVVHYYALHSGALVEVIHPEYASYPIYVSDDDFQERDREIERLIARESDLERAQAIRVAEIRRLRAEIRRLRAALRKIAEAHPNMLDPVIRMWAKEALAEQPAETEAGT